MTQLIDSFVHLYVHTDYSMDDGLMDVNGVVSLAKKLGMPAVSITDKMNQCNAVKLCECGRAKGVKPIYGIELIVYDDTSKNIVNKEFYKIKLYAMNKIGYRNIVELQSDGWRQGSIDYKTCVKKSWLEKYSQGVICLSGGISGDVAKAVFEGNKDVIQEKIDFYKRIYPNRFYIELTRCGQSGENEYIAKAVQFAKNNNIPIVATNPVMFATEQDYEIHKIRTAIQAKVVLSDPKWNDPYTPKMYMRSVEEMKELFSDLPEAIQNTVAIAMRCSVPILLGKNFLPHIDTGNLTEAEYLTKMSYEGLEERLRFLYLDEAEYEKQKPRYVQRLQVELDVIINMQFPGYFLIVMEFIQWSKNNGVPVGPGRGSGGGSLVAYAIKITDFDPLRFDLLFERFLNPERVSMPDFDVDFCTNNRDRVIKHVADLYGRQAVSQIITFGTLAAKASVKSVARVMGKSYSFGDRIAKSIPNKPGITLDIALGRVERKIELASKEFIDMYNTSEEIREVVDIACKLEGITTSHGKHAGGVVISPTVITDFAPLMCDDYGGDYKTQFDKHDVEEAGLVKFDFLGLKTLTIIDWALEMINAKKERLGEPKVDISAINLEDPESYKVLQTTETTAVFQLESNGMRGLIKKMQPDRFEDLIALVALYRPGPLECGMVDNYVDRKHGREKVSYPDPNFQHECLKPVLDPTYGIIVYQEQVMQIAQVLAGYSLGGADLLRRAMGKKQPEVMAAQKSVFKEGAEKQGINGDLALSIFDLVEKFAGYGFNKSHSAAYALVSFQTLWLKTHYPAEFLAAMMTGDKLNTDKLVSYIHDARRLNITVIPPDVNMGEVNFIVNNDGEIVFSLSAIKGVGDGHVEQIVKERKENGPFKSLFDFCRRMDKAIASKKVLEAMILGGAFDKMCTTHRRSLVASLDDALMIASQSTSDRNNGCIDIFAACGFDEFMDPPLKDVQPYSVKEKLHGEVENLGLYLTGHPLDSYKEEIKNFTNINISSIQVDPSVPEYAQPQEKITICGVIVDLQRRITKKGAPYLQGYIVDYSGKILFNLWRDDYEKYNDFLEEDMLVVVTGSASFDSFNNSNKIRIDTLENIVEARLSRGRALRISLDQSFSQDIKHSETLCSVLDKYPGNMPVELILEQDDGVLVSMTDYRVIPCDELLEEIRFKCKSCLYKTATSYGE